MTPRSPEFISSDGFSLVAFAAGWNRFFFAPLDVRICGAIRIAYGLLLLVNLGMWCPELERWFGEQGVLPLEISRGMVDPDRHTLFEWLPTSSTVLWSTYILFALQTAALTVGWCSRFNAACVFIWLVSFQNRNMLITDGEDTVFRMIGFFLIWMPIEAAFSLDARRRRLQGRSFPLSQPAWALRLLQIEMCLIFLSAGIAKFGGEAWWNGESMFYLVQLDDYFGRMPVPVGVIENPWIATALGRGVIFLELFSPLFVMFRETRRPALIVIALFHIVMESTMFLFLFHWIMLLGWMSFTTPDDWRALAALIRRRSLKHSSAATMEATAK